MDFEEIEKTLSEIPNLYRCKVHTSLEEDKVTGRPVQFRLRPCTFLLSEVDSAFATYHEAMEVELTSVGLKSGGELSIDTKYNDFVKIWELWLEQQG